MADINLLTLDLNDILDYFFKVKQIMSLPNKICCAMFSFFYLSSIVKKNMYNFGD